MGRQEKQQVIFIVKPAISTLSLRLHTNARANSRLHRSTHAAVAIFPASISPMQALTTQSERTARACFAAAEGLHTGGSERVVSANGRKSAL